MQVEFWINSISSDEAKILLDLALPLLDKKVRGSLKMTENFESENLVAYLNMADRIVDSTEITGTERYPGEMIKLINENVDLPNNIYDNLVEYYNTIYDRDLYDPQPTVDRFVTQFGRLKIGADIYGSKIVPRYENRSYIRAKFMSYSDESVDIYPGQIQCFFQYKYINEIHHLAYVRWYQSHATRRHYLLVDNERCDIEIWQEKFYNEARDCILPVQRILGRFIPTTYKFSYGNGVQKVLVVIPTNKRFNI